MQQTTTQHETFLYEEIGPVARITLNRPDTLNALTFEVYAELRDTFRDLNRRENVRAVVITGQGRGFCSGGDVEAIIGQLLKRRGEGMTEFARMTGELTRNICELRKPVVAALNGVTAGAGAAIALASDFRIAAENVKIAFLFTKVGLTGADMGVAYLLPRIVGTARAMELLYLGEPIRAERAEQIGLVTRVVKAEELERESMALAQKLAAGPTFSIGMTKVQIYNEWTMSLPAAIEAEAQAQALCMLTDNFDEGYKAFKERRAPQFHGK
ncbi:MAG: enoyl-CoA hydratase family protein [Acidobacteria bacterium]|nr:enoyl-CoA hydratase family protein [Acidobacteriota bacterium]